MAITINGTANTVAGLAVGGLPDGSTDADALASNAVTNVKVADDAIDSAEIADGAVDLAHLSATGTKSGSTFLAGDNSWKTVSDTNDTNSPSICVGRTTAAWGIASGIWILIPYNATEWNVGGGTWTAASGGDTTGSYYTVPSGGAGKYVCSYGIGMAGLDDTEILQMRLCKNGGPSGHWASSTAITKTYTRNQSASGNLNVFVNNTVVLNLAANDRIQPQVYHEEGGGNLHIVWEGTSSLHFSMFRLAGV